MPSPSPFAAPTASSGGSFEMAAVVDAAAPAAAGSIAATATLTPIQMAAQGYKQKVHIPLRVILVKIMASLKSPSEPLFRYVQLEQLAYVASVQLDVSTMTYVVGEIEPIVRIGGQQCASAELAEESASRNAFEYLARRHCVYVLDYSKSLAESIRAKPIFHYVNSALHHVEEVVDGFYGSIQCVGRFHSEVYANEKSQTIAGGVTPVAEIYKEVSNFWLRVLGRYTDKHREFLSTVKAYKDERMKFKDELDERVTQWNLKGLSEQGRFSEKDVLDYMLTYMGIDAPEYGKELEDATYVGYVKIPIPYVDGLKFSGNIILKGYNSSSAIGSEENVAAEGLKFIEREMNIEIVDFNYADRIDAQEKHGFMVVLLKNIIELGDKLKAQLAEMVHYINSGCDVYGARPENFSTSPITDDQFYTEDIEVYPMDTKEIPAFNGPLSPVQH